MEYVDCKMLCSMKSVNTLCIRYQNTLVNLMCFAKLQSLCWAMFADWILDLAVQWVHIEYL